jgi:serine phosphatase RsbU (regulator of sigma subunit)
VETSVPLLTFRSYPLSVEGACHRGRSLHRFSRIPCSLLCNPRTCFALCEPQIQRSLLPEATPELYGWQLAAHYKLPREVGSDFYDFLELEV